MTISLTAAERLKVGLLAEGLTIAASAQAYVDERNGGRPLTPADYASTSGVILALDDDVWVNAPIAAHNPNFVASSPYELVLDGASLAVRGRGLWSAARFWLPPLWHGTLNPRGEPYNSYGFTHADRVRISPIEGCAMTCKFCDLPYEFRYRSKRIEGLLDTVRRAASDEVQPARHVLISGGTPRDADIGYVRDAYEATITGFPSLPVDIMMVPIDGLLDVVWLDRLGVSEISVNLEIFNREIARGIMRRKHDQGRDHYLGFLESASAVLGGARVRSMLMVGLEPAEDTLAGVEAIARRGAVPVLSPFRPDPSTPLRNAPPPDAALLVDVYLRARDICANLGMPLGPSCIPCSHNTLTFATAGSGDAHVARGAVNLV
jgi:hypothetical protein